MNEALFLFHTFAILAFVLFALRLGKSALVSLAALQGVFANLFVLKQISLFGLSVTCSDGFAIGGMLSLNLLQEYFGKQAAKKAAHISLVCLLFFALMSQIHLLYVPTQSDLTQPAFSAIFSRSPRILFASIASFYLVQIFDISFFGRLQGKLALRVAFSLVVSQLFDTVLFSFLGLYGWVESIFDCIAMSFAIKCLVIAVSSPFTLFTKKWVKNELPL